MSLFLTDPFIRSLRPAESGRVQYFDNNVKGLCLRVSATNRKTWCVVYRFNGRVRRYTLGVYPSLDSQTLASARRSRCGRSRRAAIRRP